MKGKYRNLPEIEASHAYIIEEYVKACIFNPEHVIELTRALVEREDACILVMSLVTALLRNQDENK